MSDVVQKLWGFCHVLRHDGVDYGDYIEQITYLLCGWRWKTPVNCRNRRNWRRMQLLNCRARSRN